VISAFVCVLVQTYKQLLGIVRKRIIQKAKRKKRETKANQQNLNPPSYSVDAVIARLFLNESKAFKWVWRFTWISQKHLYAACVCENVKRALPFQVRLFLDKQTYFK
jgi:hypothetical protein